MCPSQILMFFGEDSKHCFLEGNTLKFQISPPGIHHRNDDISEPIDEVQTPWIIMAPGNFQQRSRSSIHSVVGQLYDNENKGAIILACSWSIIDMGNVWHGWSSFSSTKWTGISLPKKNVTKNTPHPLHANEGGSGAMEI